MKFSLKSIAIIVAIHLFICALIFTSLSSKENAYQPVKISDVRTNLEQTLKKYEPKYPLIPSKCRPRRNVYTPEELVDIYKYQDYGPCTTPTHDIISYVDQSVSIKCQNNTKPRYAFDKSTLELLRGSKKVDIEYDSLPKLMSRQFLIIKC